MAIEFAIRLLLLEVADRHSAEPDAQQFPEADHLFARQSLPGGIHDLSDMMFRPAGVSAFATRRVLLTTGPAPIVRPGPQGH